MNKLNYIACIYILQHAYIINVKVYVNKIKLIIIWKMNKNNLNTIRCVSCDRRGDKIGRKNINRIGTKSVIRKVKMIQKNVKLGDFSCKKCQSSAKEYDKIMKEKVIIMIILIKLTMIVILMSIMVMNLIWKIQKQKVW